MPLRAGFAEIDITPPAGTGKIGWLRHLQCDEVLDPIFARVAVLESGRERIAFIALDLLSIRRADTATIRRRIERELGFPGRCIMVAATHNHGGPAVSTIGEVQRDAAYVDALIARVVRAFGDALRRREPAEIGFASGFEWGVAFNRRVLMRDGTTRTHGRFPDRDALTIEGPIDPEVAVLGVRRPRGRLLGCIVNFTCHPTHHGGSNAVTAGYPGVVASQLRRRGCPVTLFLNGACGNVHHGDPAGRGTGSMEEAGQRLADDARELLKTMTFRSGAHLGAASTIVRLPFRAVTKAEVAGTARGAQRFIDPAIYDRGMPALVERIRREGRSPAEVQALFINDIAFAAIPAEYFVEHGLRIKEMSHPAHALVVGHANGMVGYVPTQAAFRRGGYETTFGAGSHLAPEAGDQLADAAIRLVRKHVRASRKSNR